MRGPKRLGVRDGRDLATADNVSGASKQAFFFVNPDLQRSVTDLVKLERHPRRLH
jgi:hypothetical protein